LNTDLALDTGKAVFWDGDYTQNVDNITVSGYDMIIYLGKATSDSSFILDVSSNKTIDTGFFIEKGTRLYVKEIDIPTTGSVYFTVFYGEED
jgi:hypothetical protein